MSSEIAATILTYLTVQRNTPMAQNLWNKLAKKFKIRVHKIRLLEKFQKESDAKPSALDKQKLEKYIKELLEEDEQFLLEMSILFRLDPY